MNLSVIPSMRKVLHTYFHLLAFRFQAMYFDHSKVKKESSMMKKVICVGSAYEWS